MLWGRGTERSIAAAIDTSISYRGCDLVTLFSYHELFVMIKLAENILSVSQDLILSLNLLFAGV